MTLVLDGETVRAATPSDTLGFAPIVLASHSVGTINISTVFSGDQGNSFFTSEYPPAPIVRYATKAAAMAGHEAIVAKHEQATGLPREAARTIKG